MPKNLFVTLSISAIALIAPFLFPWPYVIFLSIDASFFAPPVAVIVGLLLDLAYVGHAQFPYFTVLGCVIAVAGAFVQQFVKTRIMS